MSEPIKRLLVVGGPNGAGKTTLANAYLRNGEWLYLGADRIAQEMCPERPESVAFAAGREFLKKLHLALNDSDNLLVESTLAGKSMTRLLKLAKTHGFRTQIAFTFVDSPSTSMARVAQRVRSGGHHVPDADILRRFYRSIANFWFHYRIISDEWSLCDNRSPINREIALGDADATQIIDPEAMREFLDLAETKRA